MGWGARGWAGGEKEVRGERGACELSGCKEKKAKRGERSWCSAGARSGARAPPRARFKKHFLALFFKVRNGEERAGLHARSLPVSGLSACAGLLGVSELCENPGSW